MATYNRPGVYINELPLQAAPINTAAAANAAGAVIASFPQGPDTVTRVTSWYDFAKKFGGYSALHPATFSVGSFFKNGGTELYVKRVLPAISKKKAKVAIPTASRTIVVTPNKVQISSNKAIFTVTAGHSIPVGALVTIAGLASPFAGINSATPYTVLGAGDAPTATKFTVSYTGADVAEATVTAGTATYTGTTTAFTVMSKNRGPDGNNLRVRIEQSTTVREAGYYDFSVYQEAGTNDYVSNVFNQANAGDDVLVEQFNGVLLNDPLSSDYIVDVIGFGSNYVTILEGAVTEYNDLGAAVSPVVTYTVDGTNAPSTGTYYPLAGALTPNAPLRYSDYTGNVYVASPASGFDPAAGTGSFSVADCTIFAEFESIDQPLVFFLPDVNAKITNNSDVNTGWALAKFVYNALISWVEAPQTNGRHFVIVEGEGEETPDQAIAQSGYLTVSSRAGFYYPQVYIKDPIGRSSASVRKIGPSGAVAGLFLDTDRRYGPFKAPAGIGTKVVDALAIERAFGPRDLDVLNTGVNSDGVAAGNNVVNAIRNVPGAGVVVMGARTLKQDGTANRYVNMRRSLTYIQKRLNDLASFAVFENNTEVLWSRLITVLGVFLNDYRNQGGLRGTTTADSFYIKCDEENNPSSAIQAGEVHIEVGVALEYPAEFVIINLSQKTAE